MKQKVAIISALVHKTKLFILDEKVFNGEVNAYYGIVSAKRDSGFGHLHEVMLDTYLSIIRNCIIQIRVDRYGLGWIQEC